MLPVEFSFELQEIWPLLLLPVALFFSWFIYKKNTPRPVNTIFIVLNALRSMVWILLLVLLSRPVISWIERSEQLPQLAILIDESASIPFTGAQTDHRSWVGEMLAEMGGVKGRVFAFSDSLREIEIADLDSLKYQKNISDPESILKELENLTSEDNLAAVLFVSDGNITRGRLPIQRVSKMRSRLWVAASGRVTEQPDLVLRGMRANEKAYINLRQPLEVEYSATQLDSRSAELVLLVDGELSERAELELGPDGSLQSTEMSWLPKSAGNHLLELEIRPLDQPDEFNRDNNRRSLQVFVHEGSQQLTLIAGGLSADLAFLRRNFESLEDVKVRTIFPDLNNETASDADFGRAIKNADMLVLYGWPVSKTEPAILAKVNKRLQGIPLLLIDAVGAKPDLLDLSLVSQCGVQLSRAAKNQLDVLALHPVFGASERLADLQKIWDKLPPVGILRPDLRLPGSARALLAEQDTNLPVFALSEQAGLRRGLICLEGFWRWETGSQLSMGDNFYSPELFASLIRWLSTPIDKRLLKVEPEEDIVPIGRTLIFNANLTSEDGNPRDQADLELELMDSAGLLGILPMKSLGYGNYQAGYSAAKAGMLRWCVKAKQGDMAVLADSGRIVVDNFNPEHMESIRNQDLLQQIALAGDGSFFDLDDPVSLNHLRSGALEDELSSQIKYSQIKREFEIWASGWLLALIILLLSVEWLVRRLRGLL
jgi:hypothetical protein